jgi:hypothetical protein
VQRLAQVVAGGREEAGLGLARGGGAVALLTLSAAPAAKRIASPPACAIAAPRTSETGDVGSATIAYGWRWEM